MKYFLALIAVILVIVFAIVTSREDVAKEGSKRDLSKNTPMAKPIKSVDGSISTAAKSVAKKDPVVNKIKNIKPVNLQNKPVVNHKKSFKPSLGHAIVVNGLSPEDKKAFRAIDKEGRKHLKIVSGEKNSAHPLEMVGPIVIRTSPNKPIYLRAKDKGVFVNGASEIFVRADKDGLAKVDFQLGPDAGGYRVLITTAGCGASTVIFGCTPKSEEVVSVIKK